MIPASIVNADKTITPIFRALARLESEIKALKGRA